VEIGGKHHIFMTQIIDQLKYLKDVIREMKAKEEILLYAAGVIYFLRKLNYCN